jgi:hypothetical protein
MATCSTRILLRSGQPFLVSKQKDEVSKMELLILALLVIFAIEEIRAFLSRKQFAQMMMKQLLVTQEPEPKAVEPTVTKQLAIRASYELECQ